jgi:hypothetical protein
MAQPIYKVFLGRPTEAWYQLSQEEQDSLFAKNVEALEKAGGKPVIYCDSSWASEQWLFFGVEVYPDIEAVQKYTEMLNELNWFRYGEAITVLGTEWKEA